MVARVGLALFAEKASNSLQLRTHHVQGAIGASRSATAPSCDGTANEKCGYAAYRKVGRPHADLHWGDKAQAAAPLPSQNI